MTSSPTDDLVSPALMAKIAALENEAYQRGWQDAIAAVIDQAAASLQPKSPDPALPPHTARADGGWAEELCRELSERLKESRRQRHAGGSDANGDNCP